MKPQLGSSFLGWAVAAAAKPHGPVAEPAVAGGGSQGSLPSPPPCWLLLLGTLTWPPQSHFPPWASVSSSVNWCWSGQGGSPCRALGARPPAGVWVSRGPEWQAELGRASLEVCGHGGLERPQSSVLRGHALSFPPTCPRKTSPTSPCLEDRLMPLLL